MKKNWMIIVINVGAAAAVGLLGYAFYKKWKKDRTISEDISEKSFFEPGSPSNGELEDQPADERTDENELSSDNQEEEEIKS